MEEAAAVAAAVEAPRRLDLGACPLDVPLLPYMPLHCTRQCTAVRSVCGGLAVVTGVAGCHYLPYLGRSYRAGVFQMRMLAVGVGV